jgi:hypothetical protein
MPRPLDSEKVRPQPGHEYAIGKEKIRRAGKNKGESDISQRRADLESVESTRPNDSDSRY